MPNKSLSVSVDLTLYTVSCPGVVLKDRDEIFLEVCVFGLHKQSQPVPAIFPLYFNERFRFYKVFYNCVNPLELHEALSNETVTIEVVQKSRFIHAGVVLAQIELTAKDFLFPYPSAVPVYSGADRELLLNKTLHFNGISPKIEFASVTAVHEIHTTAKDEYHDRIMEINREGVKERSSRNRSPSPTRNLNRSKSMSSLRMSGGGTINNEKPPFVVRKVDDELLKGLEPMAATDQFAVRSTGRSKKRRSGAKKRSKSASRKTYMVERHYGDEDDYDGVNGVLSSHDYDEDKYTNNTHSVKFAAVGDESEDDFNSGDEMTRSAGAAGDYSSSSLSLSKSYSSAPIKKSYDDLRAERYLRYDVPYTSSILTPTYSEIILERLERKRMLEELEREARLARLHSSYLSGTDKYLEKYDQEMYWARKRRDLERSLDRLYERLYRL